MVSLLKYIFSQFPSSFFFSSFDVLVFLFAILPLTLSQNITDENHGTISRPPGVKFINGLRAAFACAYPKSTKNTAKSSVFFALSGYAVVKAASRTLMKLTPGNISELLNSTFLRRIGRSNKKFYDNVIGIWLPVFISQDETSHHRKEGELPQYHQPPKPHQHEVQVQ